MAMKTPHTMLRGMKNPQVWINLSFSVLCLGVYWASRSDSHPFWSHTFWLRSIVGGLGMSCMAGAISAFRSAKRRR